MLTDSELQAALGEDDKEKMDMDEEDDENELEEGEILKPPVYRLVAPRMQASRWWPAGHRSWEMLLPASKS